VGITVHPAIEQRAVTAFALGRKASAREQLVALVQVVERAQLYRVCLVFFELTFRDRHGDTVDRTPGRDDLV